jgi:large-conductance mechanosensitive channel
VKDLSRKNGCVLLMDGDPLLAVVFSFCIYAVVVVLAVKSVTSLRRALCGK